MRCHPHLRASLAGFSPGSIAALHGIARVGGRGTVNAVVWLDAPNAPASLSAGKVVLDQRNLSFLPHVLAVRTGTVVDFPNNDRVFHNVFSFRDGKVTRNDNFHDTALWVAALS